MGWTFLLLVVAGLVGGMMQAVPVTSEYARRVSGGLIALGFLGVLLWAMFLSAVALGGMR